MSDNDWRCGNIVKISNNKEDFYRNLTEFIYKGIELEVSSSPFGCDKGYSKIYVRRKDREIPYNSIELYKFHFPMPEEYSGCRQDSEIKLLKQEIKVRLDSMMK